MYRVKDKTRYLILYIAKVAQKKILYYNLFLAF